MNANRGRLERSSLSLAQSGTSRATKAALSPSPCRRRSRRRSPWGSASWGECSRRLRRWRGVMRTRRANVGVQVPYGFASVHHQACVPAREGRLCGGGRRDLVSRAPSRAARSELRVVAFSGGGIWATWMDRDLSIAGRIVVSGTSASKQDPAKEFTSHLILHRPPILRIPTVAIHLARDQNEKFYYKPVRFHSRSRGLS